MTRVLIVDDHPIVVQGCRRLLQDMGIVSIVEARSVVAGYRAYLRQRPDIVIADLTFEGDDLGGLALVRRMSAKNQALRIIVFSMHNDPAIVSNALASGASGYVLKDTPSTEFATALGRALAGEPYLSHDLAVKVAMFRAKGDRSPANGLSEREGEILALLGQGNSYDKIATRLGISYKTVTNATSVIRSKLKLGSLAELMRYAISSNSNRIV